MAAHLTPGDGSGIPTSALIRDLDVGDPASGLQLNIWIRDQEIIRAIEDIPDGRQRNEYILKALRIGVLALEGAQGQIDAAAVRSEGEHLIERVGNLFVQHGATFEHRLANTLREYFDPSTGRVNERFDQLLKGGGEMQRTVEAVFSASAASLKDQLEAYIGPRSQFAQLLAPEESNSFISMIQTNIDRVIAEQREAFVGEFTLDRPDSALARLVAALTKTNSNLSTNFEGSVSIILKEFSLDKPDSALSRLVSQVGEAQRKISTEFSLDSEHSALSRMKRGVDQALEQMRVRNETFHQSVLQALSMMAGRKQVADASPRHGVEFEEAGYQFVQNITQRLGDIPERTGARTGIIKNNKTGDFIVTIGQESAGAGVKIVFEMKEDFKYDLPAALQEIDEARRNRAADIGVFVFSKRTAPNGLQPFSRHKRDLVVVWDAEREDGDAYLEAAIHCARALAISAKAAKSNSHADFTKIDRAIEEIGRQADLLGDITTCTATIRSSNDKIQKRAEAMRDAFNKQLETLKDELSALRRVGTTTTPPSQALPTIQG